MSQNQHQPTAGTKHRQVQKLTRQEKIRRQNTTRRQDKKWQGKELATQQKQDLIDAKLCTFATFAGTAAAPDRMPFDFSTFLLAEGII